MADITKALKIKGWMKLIELRWLGEHAANCAKIVELGSWQGRSTRAMLDNSQAHLWCVDSWDRHRPKGYQAGDAEMAAFLKNVKDHLDRVTVLRLTTEAAVARVSEDAPFDMVFIDADHAYESVKHDIEAYGPLVRKGGLLSGHDYHHEAIRKVVSELIPNHSVVSRIWYARV
jgi:predicted O-methyltransferase YrrM